MKIPKCWKQGERNIIKQLCYTENYELFLKLFRLFSSIVFVGQKHLTYLIICYLFKQENDRGWFFKLETSNNSMNLWSDTLALAAANLWYSSKMEDRHHLCSFLKHPTRHPVRCCTNYWYKLVENFQINLVKGDKNMATLKYLPSLAMN